MQITHLLLVDDDLDTLHAFRMLLEKKGYVITITQTIDQAMALAERCEFDLIITDLEFPIETGFRLLKSIRSHSDVPAIAVTAHGQLKDRHEVFSAGFNAHVLKPVETKELERVITAALKGEMMIEPMSGSD
ncbi:MAG TPA: response regulator [Candidatus Kapabacteria bacterium]|nr:response regulator [Candidatus Kapabacteria bacterium]